MTGLNNYVYTKHAETRIGNDGENIVVIAHSALVAKSGCMFHAQDHSIFIAEEGATGFALAGSYGLAKKGSKVYAGPRSFVIAQKGAWVRATGDCTILAECADDVFGTVDSHVKVIADASGHTPLFDELTKLTERNQQAVLAQAR